MMIEYPSVLSPTSSSSSSSPSSSSPPSSFSMSAAKKKEWVALKTKVWDAQKLAQVVLGKEKMSATTRRDGHDDNIIQAIRAFAMMKQELDLLQRQSTLWKKLMKMKQEKKKDDDSSCPEDTEIFFDANSEDFVFVPPTKSESLGVGTLFLNDLELKVVQWHERLNTLCQSHEEHLQECEADLQKLCSRLQSLPTGSVDQIQLEETRAQLEKLVQIASSFPSRSRMEELEGEVKHLREHEKQAKQELERMREQLVEQQLRHTEAMMLQLEQNRAFQQQQQQKSVVAPPTATRSKSCGRCLVQYTKKKIRKILFRRPQRSSKINTDQVDDNGNTTNTVMNNDASTPTFDWSALAVAAASADVENQDVIEFFETTTSPTEEPLLLFDSYSDQSSDEYSSLEEEEDVSDNLDNLGNRKDVLRVYNFDNHHQLNKEKPAHQLLFTNGSSDTDSKGTKPICSVDSWSETPSISPTSNNCPNPAVLQDLSQDNSKGILRKARSMLGIK